MIRKGVFMIVFLIPVLTGIDIVFKYAINQMHKEDLPRKLGSSIEIDRFHNEGFPFGKFKENQKLVKYLPIFITSLLVGRLSLLLPKKGRKMEKISLCLIIAGSLSNLFDRFSRGYVVDYLRIKKKVADKVVFNLGDVFILLGSLMLPLVGKKKAVLKPNAGIQEDSDITKNAEK